VERLGTAISISIWNICGAVRAPGCSLVGVTVAVAVGGGGVCGNFDIILDHFSRFQLYTTQHAHCDLVQIRLLDAYWMLTRCLLDVCILDAYWMLVICCELFASSGQDWLPRGRGPTCEGCLEDGTLFFKTTF